MVRQPGVRQGRRRGITIIEVLVVLGIIGILMALLLPAVGGARASSKRVECRNKLRNLGMAMMNVADQEGRLPAIGNFGHYPDGNLKLYHSWVVDVLPWIDQKPIYDQWQFDEASDRGSNGALTQTQIPILTCPSDSTLLGGGDLSYVVNAGFGFTSVSRGVGDCPVNPRNQPMDYNGNGITCPRDPERDGSPNDKQIYKQTGVFFVQNWPLSDKGTVRFHRLADITDGLSQTMFLTENVRAGRMENNPMRNWGSPYAYGNCFYVSWTICDKNSCTQENVDYSRANKGDHAINSSHTQGESNSYWPSSEHGAGVNVVFGDGHAKFLSEYIDGAVYAALVSPQGSEITGPLAQPVLRDTDY